MNIEQPASSFFPIALLEVVFLGSCFCPSKMLLLALVFIIAKVTNRKFPTQVMPQSLRENLMQVNQKIYHNKFEHNLVHTFMCKAWSLRRQSLHEKQVGQLSPAAARVGRLLTPRL